VELFKEAKSIPSPRGGTHYRSNAVDHVGRLGYLINATSRPLYP